MWEWLATVKAETWGAFAVGLIVSVIKVLGPALTRYATVKWRREEQELEALDENARKEVVEPEASALRIELGLAQRDLNDAAEDLRRMANALAIAERERDAWKQRAVALAREQGLIRPESEDVRTNLERASRTGPTARPAAAARRVADVRTVPPRKPNP